MGNQYIFLKMIVHITSSGTLHLCVKDRYVQSIRGFKDKLSLLGATHVGFKNLEVHQTNSDNPWVTVYTAVNGAPVVSCRDLEMAVSFKNRPFGLGSLFSHYRPHENRSFIHLIIFHSYTRDYLKI